MAFITDAIFFYAYFLGAISSFPLYLFLLKDSNKRMPLQSGLEPTFLEKIQGNQIVKFS
jgi:hypothetical protein